MNNRCTKFNQSNSFEITLSKAHVKGKWLNIIKDYRCLFPNVNKSPIIIEYNGKPFHTSLRLHPSRYHNLAGWGLTEWFNTYEPSEGDKLRITKLQNNKYRLEVVK